MHLEYSAVCTQRGWKRRFVNSHPGIFFSRSYLLFFAFRTKKDGRVLLSTRVGSRIGPQEKGKQLQYFFFKE